MVSSSGDVDATHARSLDRTSGDAIPSDAIQRYHPGAPGRRMSGSGEFIYSGTELDAMRHARNYYRMIADRFAPHLGDSVIEVGAGTGTFSHVLLGRGGIERLMLVEPDAANAQRLAARFRDDARVTVHRGYLESAPDNGEVSSVVMVNVLEHVPDDVATLRAAFARLRPNAKILIFVPAVSQIFGTLDRAFGHERRYSRALLRKALGDAGFVEASVAYTNLPGVIAWFVAGRILRKSTIREREVLLYDRFVIPWVARLERLMPMPVGQTLIAVAARPA